MKVLSFSIFKKKLDIFAPISGKLKSLELVNDPVFSQKLIGDGFAIVPDDSEVFSPISGTITNIFPTKHAIGLKDEKGLEILLHFGIDTVELRGEPFKLFVSENEKVTTHTKIAEINLNKLYQEKKESDLLVIFTNREQYTSIEISDKSEARVQQKSSP